MKNKRAFLMMALAVLFGLAAVVLASRWMQSKTASTMRRVVVAVNDVSRGQRLLPEMLTLAEWRTGDLPKDAFTDLSKLTDRVLKSNLVRGEPLVESKLAPAGTVGGLSALITEGKRAITVRVNDVIGVAGFALPGNFVDVIVHTERDPGENEKTQHGALHISKIVLERILVLAVAQEVSRDESKPKVVNAVTLEVTPEQAETLDLARGVGTLSLALRNQTDQAAPETAGATKRSVLELPEPPAPKAVAAVAKAAPARARTTSAAAAAPVVVQARRDCVSVINGVHTAQECF
jgi:pilus assembly protein CpaB